MLIAVIDLESIPNQSIPQECIPQFDPESVKYGNIKDPDKIELKKIEARESFMANRDKQMSLDPGLLQICTFVGLKYDTDSKDVISQVSVQVTDEDRADDLEAVTDGWNFIRSVAMERTPIITFNGLSFDFPAMFQRAIIQDVPVDPVMYQRLMGRYNNPYHYDLLPILTNSHRIADWAGKNLDFWLQLYKIGTKGEMDGSQVYEAWKNKEFDRIKQYCMKDVANTANLFVRVAPWIKIEKGEN